MVHLQAVEALGTDVSTCVKTHGVTLHNARNWHLEAVHRCETRTVRLR